MKTIAVMHLPDVLQIGGLSKEGKGRLLWRCRLGEGINLFKSSGFSALNLIDMSHVSLVVNELQANNKLQMIFGNRSNWVQLLFELGLFKRYWMRRPQALTY